MADNKKTNPDLQSQETNSDWSKDPSLSVIDSAKLNMLLSLTQNGKLKSQSELLPFLLAASKNSRENGLSFSPAERELIIQVIKKGKSPEEAARIDQFVSLLRSTKR